MFLMVFVALFSVYVSEERDKVVLASQGMRCALVEDYTNGKATGARVSTADLSLVVQGPEGKVLRLCKPPKPIFIKLFS